MVPVWRGSLAPLMATAYVAALVFCACMSKHNIGPILCMCTQTEFSCDCGFHAQALVRLGLDIIAEDRLVRAIKIEKDDAVMQSMLKQIRMRLKKTDS